MSHQATTAPTPSSNWRALRKKLPTASSQSDPQQSATPPPKNKHRAHHESGEQSEISFIHGRDVTQVRSVIPVHLTDYGDDLSGEDSKAVLRKMISGELKHSSSHQQPGKYLALDCEMVGVGPGGRESSLARVSIVNFYGHVLLDTYVRQRERVVDYRTQWSGIRARDMVNAKPFAEVQKTVADLLKDCILVGHAVHNDLKALLLSHPRHQTRDTQLYAHMHKVVKTRYPALRNLVQQELGVAIQTGEHSSVTDARATMAVYRLHRKEWEKGQRQDGQPSSSKKRKRAASDAQSATTSSAIVARKYVGGGRKGVSSGLSTIVMRKETSTNKDQWWTKLD
ncbi:ribonuclease H-like protein [Daedalea quercina L-15889]|uniref:RNA exonuclease 4 n=1 Tax=Daedalea quercina L-15889 TaxID=1314783 RepID=A0A165QNG8_9APHY|nr:ribonuclease H-like protein [Daedalea quercina L-15889]